MHKYNNGFLYRNTKTAILTAIVALAITGCGGSDNDENPIDDTPAGQVDGETNDPDATANPNNRAFVATRADDYSSGQVERIVLHEISEQHDGAYPATGSDISVEAGITHIYQLGRSNLDSITKFDPDQLDGVVYQRSVAGDDVFANPYQLIVADITTAYLIRYGSDKIWIVDPSATEDEDFKTGELDLSAYNDGDGFPEPNSALLIGDRLFVMMERLESFLPVQQGYVAVFDTTTGEEIDTGKGEADGLKGIPLGVNNPIALQQPEEGGLIYAVGRGNFFAQDASAGDRFTGGIVAIDPETYAVNLVLDDGDETNNNGFIVNALATDAENAYVVHQRGFGDDVLLKLNLSSGELAAGSVAGIEGVAITTLAKGPMDRLWVGRDSRDQAGEPVSPGFTLLDLVDDSVSVEKVATQLVPINVVFLDNRN